MSGLGRIALKLFRGTWGKDVDALTTNNRPTIGATESRSLAEDWSVPTPEELNSVDNNALSQVWQLDVEAQNFATFDDMEVTIDQLQSKFDLDPMEVQALTERMGADTALDINMLADDPMFVDMLRKREYDVLVSPEVRKGSTNPSTEMNTGNTYRILDPKAIKNRRRVTQYLTDDLGFYSPARRVIELADQDRGDSGYWKSKLTVGIDDQRPKFGIYPKKDADEIGLFDYLDSIEGSISREELLKYVDDNRTPLSEVMYVGRGDGDENTEFNWSIPEPEEDVYRQDYLNAESVDLEYELDIEDTTEVNNFLNWSIERNRSGDGQIYWDDFTPAYLGDVTPAGFRKFELVVTDSRRRELLNEGMPEEFFSKEGADSYKVKWYLPHEYADNWVHEEALNRYNQDPFLTTSNDEGYEIVGADGRGFDVIDPSGTRLDWFSDINEAISYANLDAINRGYTGENLGNTIDSQWFPSYTLSEIAAEEGVNPKNILVVWDDAGGVFHHSHFSDADYFAHARTEERTIDGVYSMHIDEIQSDWHHLGVDKGMVGKEGKPKIFIGQSQAPGSEGLWQVRQPDGAMITELGTRGPFKDNHASKQDALDHIKELQEQKFLPENAEIVDADIDMHPVQYAPYAQNWHEIMFKRAIAEGLKDPNIKRITWTTADTQARRYKSHTKYQYFENLEVLAIPEQTRGIPEWVLSEDGENFSRFTEVELRKMFGNVVAEQMMQVGDEPVFFKDVVKGVSKGFKDIYDQKLPQFSKKFLSRYGVRIGKTRINPNQFVTSERDGKFYVQAVLTGTYEGQLGNKMEFTSEAAMRNFLEAAGNVEVWYFDITDEMREDLLQQGMPLTMGGDEDNERMAA